MQFKVGGQDVKVKPDGFSLSDRLNSRSVLSMTIVDDDGTLQVQKGQKVEVWDDLGDKLYGGFIDSYDTRLIGQDGARLIKISSKDWHYLADKRICARTYKDQTAGDIVRDLITNYLCDEEVNGLDVTDSYTGMDFNGGTKDATLTVDAGGLKLSRTGTDIAHTDTLTADFDAGTKVNVTSAGNKIELVKTGTDYSHTDTTTGDFDQGTKTSVDSSNNQIALVPRESTWLSGYGYRKKITIGSYRSVWWARWWQRDSGNVLTMDYTAACFEELITAGHIGASNRDPGGDADYYNARFETTIQVPATGSWTFYANSDDGVRIWVGGTQIINDWTSNAASERSGSITLNANTPYDVVIEHVEGAGGEGLTISVAGPGYSKQNLPGSWIYWRNPALTDYPFKFRIYKGTGTDGNGNVYLNNHNLSWASSGDVVPNDVRFTAADKVTQLSWGIETWDANSATVWVKIPGIPAAPGVADFYIYYGKSGDVHNSNFAAIALYIAPFWGADDRSNWTTYGDSHAPATAVDTANGYYKITETDAESYFAVSNTFNNSYGSDTSLSYCWEVLAYKQSDNQNRNHIGVIVDADMAKPFYFYRLTTLDGNYTDSKFINGSETGFGSFSNSSTYADQRWVRHRVYRNRGTGYLRHEAEYNGTVVSGSTWANKEHNHGSVGFHAYGGESWFCFAWARKWHIVDPYFAWTTAEESCFAVTTGTWQMHNQNLASVGTARSSAIVFSKYEPAGTSVVLQTSLDNVTWNTVTSGQSIPGISTGTPMAGKTLYVKATLNGTNSTTPILYDVSITCSSAYNSTGTWTSPALNISSVNRLKTAILSWNPTSQPSGTSITFQTSVDGGVTFQSCANGGNISGLSFYSDMNGKTVIWKATFTSDGSATPTLNDVTANFVSAFNNTGTWISPGLDLSRVAYTKQSTTQVAYTSATGATLNLWTSIDDGFTWSHIDADTFPIAGIVENTFLGGKKYKVKATLTSDGNNTYTLTGLTSTFVNGTIHDGETLKEAAFNYVPVSRALQLLAERCGYWWCISADRVLYFAPKEYLRSSLGTVGSGQILLDGAGLKTESPDYRNRQIIKGGMETTGLQNQTLLTNGVLRNWTLNYPLSQVPTIKVNGVVKTTGIKGAETGKDFYWNKGDSIISQDLGASPLQSSSVLTVDYKGEFPIVVITKNDAEIQWLKDVESIGSGIVDCSVDAPTLNSSDSALEFAGNLLSSYAKIGRAVEFNTTLDGFHSGEIITLDIPEFGLFETDMLIASVDLKYSGKVKQYHVKATESKMVGDWSKMYSNLNDRGLVIREGLKENEVVVNHQELAEAMTLSESHGTETTQVYNVQNGLYPGANVYPG